MAYIDYVAAISAQPELASLYESHRTSHGDVDNILKIHGLNPPSLTAHYELYRTLMFGKSELSRTQREMIAVVVSALNECEY